MISVLLFFFLPKLGVSGTDVSATFTLGGNLDQSMFTIGLAPKFGLSEALSLKLGASLVQDLRGERRLVLGNAQAALRLQKQALGPFSVSPAAILTVPMNEDSLRRDSLSGAFGLQLDVGVIKVGETFEVSYSPSVIRNVHRFETSTTGASNAPWILGQTISLEWSPISRILLSADFGFLSSWTYAGVVQSSFEFSQTLGVEVSSEVTFSLGHSNGGNTLRPNGLDSNLAFFDSNRSTFFGAMVVRF